MIKPLENFTSSVQASRLLWSLQSEAVVSYHFFLGESELFPPETSKTKHNLQYLPQFTRQILTVPPVNHTSISVWVLSPKRATKHILSPIHCTPHLNIKLLRNDDNRKNYTLFVLILIFYHTFLGVVLTKKTGYCVLPFCFHLPRRIRCWSNAKSSACIEQIELWEI